MSAYLAICDVLRLAALVSTPPQESPSTFVFEAQSALHAHRPNLSDMVSYLQHLFVSVILPPTMMKTSYQSSLVGAPYHLRMCKAMST